MRYKTIGFATFKNVLAHKFNTAEETAWTWMRTIETEKKAKQCFNKKLAEKCYRKR